MSFAYQEILEEGFEKGRATEALSIARKLLRARFGEKHGLDPVLERCRPEDLEWMVEQIFQVKTPEELAALLEEHALPTAGGVGVGVKHQHGGGAAVEPLAVDLGSGRPADEAVVGVDHGDGRAHGTGLAATSQSRWSGP